MEEREQPNQETPSYSSKKRYNERYNKRANKRVTLKEVQELGGKVLEEVMDFLHDITDIREGLDEQGTRDSIQKNIEIKGSNVWLLMSAIMVASLGLNLNSPAVIIGAMLISPLMSPILGIGLSVGINDQKTLNQSLYHFAVAIAVSLITSAFYFRITPLSGEATSEILARTSPTILDVLVAFFGGIAGIVSGSRKEKSNAIPGVAIATALLPPLCVSGYGLANGEWTIFLNSLYLFFLNSVFIALATYLVVRYLRFRPKKYVDSEERKRSVLFMVVFVFLIIIPSIFILRNVAQDIATQRNAKIFVEKYFENDDRDVRWECQRIEGFDSLLLKVSIVGDTISKDSIASYNALLVNYNLEHISLKVIQNQFADFVATSKANQVRMTKERDAYQVLVSEKDAQIQMLRMQVQHLQSAPSLLKDMELIDPQIEMLQFGEMILVDTTQRTIPTLTIQWKKNTSRSHKRTYSKRLEAYLKSRLGIEELQLLEQ